MYKIQSLEDQEKFIVPLNKYSELIAVDQRLVIDAPVTPPAEPRVWEITKLNRLATNGLLTATCALDRFDQHKDEPEYDNNGNVIAWWADYKTNILLPDTEIPTDTYSSITYSGTKAEIKIGGSYKKFTVNFYDSTDNPTDFQTGSWKFEIFNPKTPEDKTDASNLVTVLTSADSDDVLENQIKVKFNGDELYMGYILEVSYVSDVSASVQMKIISL